MKLLKTIGMILFLTWFAFLGITGLLLISWMAYKCWTNILLNF